MIIVHKLPPNNGYDIIDYNKKNNVFVILILRDEDGNHIYDTIVLIDIEGVVYG
ncbi:MAG: hypothetical protein ACOX4P_04685 [Anaerovoracaceae bacterium]